MGFAQNDLVNQLQHSYSSQVSNTLNEKMFLHTDKSFYLAGEIAWFKIYNVSAASHKLTDVSKVAYVEVLNSESKPVLQLKTSLNGGTGEGSVYLPLNMATGNYTLRAYTNWMKNFGAGSFFEKNISVVNTLTNPQQPVDDTTTVYQVSFFPEGGNLVYGLQSRVALKVTDSDKGLSYKGYIISNEGDTLSQFQSAKFGMGSFPFTPQQGKDYAAKLVLENGKTITKTLPKPFTDGYAMQVEPLNDQQLKVTVQKTTGLTNAANIYLMASNRQQLKFAERATFMNNMAVFHVDKKALGEGITVITLFDNNRQPVCERLHFTPPSEILTIKASTDAAVYQQRKNVSISFSPLTPAGKSTPANLSVSVYAVDSVQTPDAQNILNYLWLTSELNGPVEAPQYYFNSNDAELESVTDLLMLTNGWRRFSWEREALSGKKPLLQYAPEYDGHFVSGRAKNMYNGALAGELPVYLSIPGALPKFYTVKSNKEGFFQINLKEFYGPNEIVLQTNTEKDSLYQLEVLSPFFESAPVAQASALTLTSGKQHYLILNSIGMQVQNVYHTENLNTYSAPAVDTLPFYGPANYRYKLDDYTRFTTMEEVLREYVREINVRKRGGKFQMLLYNEPQQLFFQENSLVLLDGIPVFDQDKLFAYSPLKIKNLDVLTRRYFLGSATFDGIANFTTYKGEGEGFSLNPQAVILDYDGLQLQREFYMPNYSSSDQNKNRLPDLRNVLYWKSDAAVEKLNTKQLNFYTSDRKGKFLILIQGIDTDGRAGATTLTFDVN